MNHAPPFVSTAASSTRGEAAGEMSATDVLQTLRAQTLTVVGSILAGTRRCALVDYPDHANVGDSMIWLGEVLLLTRLGIEVRYTCSRRNYDRAMLARQIGPDGAILIHGGGNFGTLWPAHQAFRERLLADFPQHRIVQMPQSINFESDEAALATASARIARHGDFKLLVRDVASRELACANFECVVELCPDMAFMIPPLRSQIEPSVDYFLLARTDKERAAGWSRSFLDLPSESSTCRDWLGFSLTEWALARAEGAGRSVLGHAGHANWMWERLMREEARARMRRGVHLLSRGRVVITDRLHAHLLCALLDKPHVILGDAHGKVRALYDTWSSRFSCAHWCDDGRDALDAARALLGRGCTPPPRSHAFNPSN
jgi:pyruvyl transferase EpsO